MKPYRKGVQKVLIIIQYYFGLFFFFNAIEIKFWIQDMIILFSSK